MDIRKINKLHLAIVNDNIVGYEMKVFTDESMEEAYIKNFLSIPRDYFATYDMVRRTIPVYSDDTWETIMERGYHRLSLEYDRKQWKAWCLKQKHEGEHKVEQTGLSFGQAIEAIKARKRCSRVGWNGKNQYIELATNISYKDAHGDIINASHDAIGNHAIAFVGTSGVQLGWLASQADVLAEDWQIVD